jgi:hypothetical protein
MTRATWVCQTDAYELGETLAHSSAATAAAASTIAPPVSSCR